MGDVFDEIRERCEQVTKRARSLRLDEPALLRLVDELTAQPSTADPDPAHHRLGDAQTTLAFVMTLDAINFGSGWFPQLSKRPGMSGYFTIASSLRERFEQRGPWSAGELVALDARDCAEVLGQDADAPGVAELMSLFARALQDLGHFLGSGYAGRFAGPVEAAAGSAARLVEILAEMPLYGDVADYDGLRVPFYKRAQITAADLAAAFEARGPGRFEDLHRLTAFADNLVPHVLRCQGVLEYAPELAQRIDEEQLLEPGSPQEVEIRAAAVHAVDRCVTTLGQRGVAVTAAQLDAVLWNRGQRPEFKARPRHRARCAYY